HRAAGAFLLSRPAGDEAITSKGRVPHRADSRLFTKGEKPFWAGVSGERPRLKPFRQPNGGFYKLATLRSICAFVRHGKEYDNGRYVSRSLRRVKNYTRRIAKPTSARMHGNIQADSPLRGRERLG